MGTNLMEVRSEWVSALTAGCLLNGSLCIEMHVMVCIVMLLLL